jgi:hypothetical protein
MEHYIKFTPQIDESADVAGSAQLLFRRNVYILPTVFREMRRE